MIRHPLFLSILLLFGCQSRAQIQSATPSFTISVGAGLQAEVRPEGRLILKLRAEGGRTLAYGTQLKGLDRGPVTVKPTADWVGNNDVALADLPAGAYTVWAEFDQKEFGAADGFPYVLKSAEKTVTFAPFKQANLSLTKATRAPVFQETDLLKEFSFRSAALSDFHGRDVTVKAAILLPAGYADNPGKRYPIRYNVAGYGGRYTRVQRILGNESFMEWYTSGAGPQIISVYLDSDGPYGDNYQLNSANSGPFGDALIKELIPQLEAKYRALPGSDHRFVDGCSTGGWVSLALQTFYPDVFGGCYSYSPDPVTFSRMQLINLYEDPNAFFNASGYERPSSRDIYGDPTLSIRQEVTDENVTAPTGTYNTSRGQWGAWNALYSAKGEDGYPKPAFDPVTGKIDPTAVKHWRQYDLLQYTKKNWTTLGPKLQGKVYVWMGDMDNYYLNNALREYDAFLKTTSRPKSDAVIEFVPMEGHCSGYSGRRVLEQIMTRY
ncbi:esterase family protein [Lewinella sp. 4G2]|uniref:alpha/beta hydrolase n=1 Tax=Lewinella sp. 4G2 TaxID=1803372 RepID=UPI0007B4931D|nr:alpha/beta hydrolase-fold protein [Lewinella sp. 4G2]OAV43559.1 hypothetical protein A3850_003195 [Lewinella sp. 4G2]